MKSSPKLLPLLARKAGLSLEKAEALWREAFANESFTLPSNPDLFFCRVLEHFRQHAAQESASSASAASRSAPLQTLSVQGNRPVNAGLALA